MAQTLQTLHLSGRIPGTYQLLRATVALHHCLAGGVAIKLSGHHEFTTSPIEGGTMNNLGRGCLAGWGASKLGGGIIGTILVFIVLYWLLGYVF